MTKIITKTNKTKYKKQILNNMNNIATDRHKILLTCLYMLIKTKTKQQ